MDDDTNDRLIDELERRGQAAQQVVDEASALKGYAARRAALPTTVYVKRETNRDDPARTWIVAAESLEVFVDGEVVGVYEWRETRTVKVTRALT